MFQGSLRHATRPDSGPEGTPVVPWHIIILARMRDMRVSLGWSPVSPYGTVIQVRDVTLFFFFQSISSKCSGRP